MPCYQTSTISVEFDPKNLSLLKTTVDKMGLTLHQNKDTYTIIVDGYNNITIKDGVATGESTLVNKLRVNYSQTLVDHAKDWAKQKGWQVQKKGTNKLSIFK